jgi:hypothetical protein
VRAYFGKDGHKRMRLVTKYELNFKNKVTSRHAL